MILKTTIENVRVYIEQTGFFVADCSDGIVIKGTAIFPPTGNVTLEGAWTSHSKYGRQFSVKKIIYENLIDIYTMLLSSGFLTGLKRSKAQSIILKLGDKVFEVLDACLNSPDTLMQWDGQMMYPKDVLMSVNGVGKVVSAQILLSWEAQREFLNPAILSTRAGFSAKQFHLALRTLGAEEFQQWVIEEPYSFTTIYGFRWDDVDLLARMEWEGKAAIPADHPVRVAAGIREVLDEKYQQGHLAYPVEDVLYEAAHLLEIGTATEAWSAVKDSLLDHSLIALSSPIGDMITSKKLFQIEKDTADRITKIMNAKFPVDIDMGNIEIDTFSKFQLSDGQRKAVETVLTNNFTIITGGPGTGKSTAALSTATAILARLGITYVLCSPTGKAAIRMQESTGEESYTLHRFFEIYKEEDEWVHLAADYIFIDEASMIDAQVLRNVLTCIPAGSRVVLIGDSDQLPPVGAGEPLFQMLQTKIPHVHLDTIFRQATHSGIIVAAHDINHGVVPKTGENKDFFLVNDVANNIPSRVLSAIDYLSKSVGILVDDIQVLTPINGGNAGRTTLNATLKKTLNPTSVEVVGIPFSLGDKVIHIKNDYDLGVMNGEVGTIEDLAAVEMADGRLGIPKQEDWESIDKVLASVYYPFGDKHVPYTEMNLEKLQLAYALTIHKAQGSEFDAVIVVLPFVREGFLLRQLPYTAITRAKKVCVVISEARHGRSAIESFVQSTRRQHKYSLLGNLL